MDGGFGDAITVSDVIGFCTSKTKAEKYIEKYENDHVYDSPYSDLHCGMLVVEELKKINHKCFENAWWLE